MSDLPVIEVFLRADPLEAVVISDPPVEVNQPIFQIVNINGVLSEDDIGVTVQPYDSNTVIDADYSELKALAETALQPGDIDLSPYALSSDVNLALGDKVDKITGKQLSSEDYTSTEKTKLSGIESGAQVNPDLTPYALTSTVNTALSGKVDKVEGKQLSTEDYTSTEKTKLLTIESGAQVNLSKYESLKQLWVYG